MYFLLLAKSRAMFNAIQICKDIVYFITHGNKDVQWSEFFFHMHAFDGQPIVKMLLMFRCEIPWHGKEFLSYRSQNQSQWAQEDACRLQIG